MFTVPAAVKRVAKTLAANYCDKGRKVQLRRFTETTRRQFAALGWDVFARAVGSRFQLIFRPTSPDTQPTYALEPAPTIETNEPACRPLPDAPDWLDRPAQTIRRRMPDPWPAAD